MSHRIEQQCSSSLTRSDSVAAGAGSRFRSRALDPNRSLPIWMRSALHERADYHGQASRAVPIMPSGVDKDEESEYHLKKALEAHSYKQDGNNNLHDNLGGDMSPNSILRNAEKGTLNGDDGGASFLLEIKKANKAMQKKIEKISKISGIDSKQKDESGFIPCPGGQIVVETDRVLRPQFKQGKHFYKHNQLNSVIQEPAPSYDYDELDLKFVVNSLNINLTNSNTLPERFSELFERIFDAFDEACPLTNAKLTLPEAKFAVQNDSSLNKLRKLCIAQSSGGKAARESQHLLSFFEDQPIKKLLGHYNAKRVINQEKLLTPVLHHDELDPMIKSAYVCFRRRVDKRVVTRRNRRNDENNFEKMIRLQTELVQVRKQFKLVHLREQLKKEYLASSADVLRKREKNHDFSGVEAVSIFDRMSQMENKQNDDENESSTKKSKSGQKSKNIVNLDFQKSALQDSLLSVTTTTRTPGLPDHNNKSATTKNEIVSNLVSNLASNLASVQTGSSETPSTLQQTLSKNLLAASTVSDILKSDILSKENIKTEIPASNILKSDILIPDITNPENQPTNTQHTTNNSSLQNQIIEMLRYLSQSPPSFSSNSVDSAHLQSLIQSFTGLLNQPVNLEMLMNQANSSQNANQLNSLVPQVQTSSQALPSSSSINSNFLANFKNSQNSLDLQNLQQIKNELHSAQKYEHEPHFKLTLDKAMRHCNGVLFDINQMCNRYQKSLVERKEERHYRRQLKKQIRETQKRRNQQEQQQQQQINTANIAQILEGLGPEAQQQVLQAWQLQNQPHILPHQISTDLSAALAQPSPNLEALQKTNTRQDKLLKLRQQAANLTSEHIPPSNHIYAKWYWSRYPISESTISSGATQNNFGHIGNVIYTRNEDVPGQKSSPTHDVPPGHTNRKVPISGEFSWENNLVGKSEPPAILSKRISRYAFRRKRDSQYISVKPGNLMLDPEWYNKKLEIDRGFLENRNGSFGEVLLDGDDLGLLGRVELQSEIRLKRSRLSVEDGFNGSRRASPTTSDEKELLNHSEGLTSWWDHQWNMQQQYQVPKLVLDKRNYVTPRCLQDCADMALKLDSSRSIPTTVSNISVVSNASESIPAVEKAVEATASLTPLTNTHALTMNPCVSTLSITTNMLPVKHSISKSEILNQNGILGVVVNSGNIQETPTTPARRQPRRASLAANAKWGMLKKNAHAQSNPNAPTSPGSNATSNSGRQSALTRQLSPASLSTGTLSTDGTEASNLRVPLCHSDGSNTSGVDSVADPKAVTMSTSVSSEKSKNQKKDHAAMETSQKQP